MMIFWLTDDESSEASALEDKGFRQFFSCLGFIAGLAALISLNYVLLGRGWAYGALLLALTPIGIILGGFFYRSDVKILQSKQRGDFIRQLTQCIIFLSWSMLAFFPHSFGRLQLSGYAIIYINGVALLVNLLLSWRFVRLQRKVQVAEEE